VLHVDCANGVGASKLEQLAPRLVKAGLLLQLHNTGAGVLNGNCGSDFLQKDKALPEGYGDVAPGSR
jgi:phosphoacetylglucosamine mutase